MILAADIPLGEWDAEWQNKYCISEWDGVGGFSAKITYIMNEQDYPIEMRTYYDSREEPEVIFLEYEPY